MTSMVSGEQTVGDKHSQAHFTSLSIIGMYVFCDIISAEWQVSKTVALQAEKRTRSLTNNIKILGDHIHS